MYQIRPEVPGGLGERTVMNTDVHPPVVAHLHFVFVGWMGDDLVESFPCFLVSERLRFAIESARLSGVEFRDVEVEVDEQSAIFDPEFGERLPTWFWLRPTARVGSDFWQDDLAQLFVSVEALHLLEGHGIEHAEVVWIEAPTATPQWDPQF